MFKAIIADDEIRICMLLQRLIDWSAMEIEIVGECHDGRSTLQAIYDLKPDIVISDIKMPGMDGLEIVKHCREIGIKCVFLLISGHAEFEYALMAIQYNVENYLLKPINKTEMEDNLNQIIRRLKKEREKDAHQEDSDRQREVDRDSLRSQFLTNILLIPDWMLQKVSENTYDRFHIDEDRNEKHYVAVLECIDKNGFTEEQQQVLLSQVMGYAGRAFQKQIRNVITATHFSHIFFLLSDYRIHTLRKAIAAVFERVQVRFFEYCDVVLGVSGQIESLEEAGVENRLQAERAARFRFNEGNGKVYYFDEVGAVQKKLSYEGLINEFKMCIETVDVDRLKRLFDNMYAQIGANDVDPDLLIEMTTHIEVELLEYIRRMELKSYSIAQVTNDINAIISRARSKAELLSNLREYIIPILETQRERGNNSQSLQIETAIKYIRENYGKDISLDEISGMVYLNPAYFSTLFKKVTGQNFVDYLQKVRIKEAQNLLSNTHMPISEIAEKTGYKSAHYFSKVFLKAVGIKPTEYRRLYSNQ